MKIELNKHDHDHDYDDCDYYLDETRIVQREKHKGNLSIWGRTVDSWYRTLERSFAPGCYFIKNKTAKRILSTELSSRIVCVSKSGADWGDKVRLQFNPGKAFSDSIIKKRFSKIFPWKMNFSRPICIEDSPVRIAIGERCFVDGSTIVLDIRDEYFLSVPNFITKALSGVEFYIKGNIERAGCRTQFPYVDGDFVVKCSCGEKDDHGCYCVDIECSDELKNCIPDILYRVETAEGDEIEQRKTSFKKAGIYFVGRADSTGFMDEDRKRIGLSCGKSNLVLEEEEAKRLTDSLNALNRAMSGVPSCQAEKIDEMWCEENALYQRWHRGWSCDRFDNDKLKSNG